MVGGNFLRVVDSDKGPIFGKNSGRRLTATHHVAFSSAKYKHTQKYAQVPVIDEARLFRVERGFEQDNLEELFV